MASTQVQHYVPLFLLKGFIERNKSKLCVFDKTNGKTFYAKPKNVVAEHGFYDTEFNGITYTLENSLSDLENKASKIIKRLRVEENLKTLSTADREILSYFIAIQYLRTKYLRENMREMVDQIGVYLEAMGANPENVKNFSYLSAEDLKKECNTIIVKLSNDIANNIVNKDWILTKTTIDNNYIISDNPVTLHNQFDYGLFGNIGFAVKGIEINMPISNTLSLYIICTSLGDQIRKEKRDGEELLTKFPRRVSKDIMNKLVRINDIYKSITDGEPLLSDPENVLFKNSLQVGFSIRWIFSPTDNYDLVKEMLKGNPSLKYGSYSKPEIS